MTADEGLELRKRLTFEQAEGAEPLPTQLDLRELSPLLRSAIWAVIYEDMKGSMFEGELSDLWELVTYDWHVYRKHRPVDEYIPSFPIWAEEFKRIFLIGSYTDVFGLLQRILRQDSPQIALRCSPELRKRISLALQIGRAAYRVLDGNTIVPIGSSAELETVQRAFVDLAATEFHGARRHLQSAAEELTSGKNADSIRESIHAVESIVRAIEPQKDFSKALAILEQKVGIHGALRSGFGSIYGYTSDEKGIRHPLLDDPKAKVDETDALFMIGACAAFVSYLINKARAAGIFDRPTTR